MKRPRIHPLARTVVLGLVGVACILAGYVVASPPAVAVGVLLVVGIIVDGVRFRIAESREPLPRLLRSVVPNPCPAGDVMSVRLLPAVAGEGLNSEPIEETLPVELSTRMVVHPIDPKAGPGRVHLAYDVVPQHRGQWTLGPCTSMRFSPLGLWWTRVADQSLSRVVAWPRTVPLEMPAVAQDREGMVGTTGFVEPQQDNAIVRMYNPGDDLRRVHWRSSARRGELMTRAEEPTDTNRAWVGLMIPLGTIADRRELAISLAASWLLELEEAGYTVDLACGGEVHHGLADDHLTRLATLTNAQAARGLPPTTPEGLSLLVATRAASRTIPYESLVRPPYGATSRAAGAIAVVLSDSDVDEAMVESVGWRTLRLADGVGLAEAGWRLASFMEAAHPVGMMAR